MATYSLSTKRYVGDKATIVCHDEQGREVPVVHLVDGEEDFPGDLMQLAANIVSLLNGNEPMHKINVGNNRILWAKTPYGSELRIQKGDANGQ
jgi:hypothetical protein